MVDSAWMIDNDRLVATLNELGVCYIAGDSEAQPYTDLTPAQIIAAMMTCGAVRVEYAVIPLVIRRPEFATAIPKRSLTFHRISPNNCAATTLPPFICNGCISPRLNCIWGANHFWLIFFRRR